MHVNAPSRTELAGTGITSGPGPSYDSGSKLVGHNSTYPTVYDAVQAVLASNPPAKTVSSMAALRLVSGAEDGQTIALSGYSSENDGGGGIFVWNATSTTADDGGTIIAPTGVGTGRWYRVFTGDVWVNWFGADPTGATACDTAFANAIAYCKSTGHNTLRVAAGTGYISNATIVVNAPIRIIGEGAGVDANPTGTLTSNTCISCASTHAATPLFQFISSNPSNHHTLIAPGFMGIGLKGNPTGATPATMGIQASGVENGEWDLLADEFTSCGLQFDCKNGNLQNAAYNRIKIIYRAGSGAATSASDALHLYQAGDSSAIGCSENIVYLAIMYPPYETGYAVVLGGDHNLVINAIGSVRFINSGNNFGWDNTVLYSAGFVADTGTYGNDVKYLGSLGNSATLNGSAQAHYTAIDDATSGKFETPTYPMYDVLNLGALQFNNYNGTLALINSTDFEAIYLADGQVMTATLGAPFNWNNGNIVGVIIYWVADTANTGTVLLNARIGSLSAGTAFTTPPSPGNISIPSTAYTVGETVRTVFNFGTPVAHTLNNLLQISVSRTTDTYTGKVGIIGVQVLFQASGPYSTGHGTYNFNGMGT